MEFINFTRDNGPGQLRFRKSVGKCGTNYGNNKTVNGLEKMAKPQKLIQKIYNSDIMIMRCSCSQDMIEGGFREDNHITALYS